MTITKQEVIEMAIDSGLQVSTFDGQIHGFDVDLFDLAVVIYRRGVRDEREACAKVCDERAMKNENSAQDAESEDCATSLRAAAWQMSICAATIRARGE